MLFSWSFFRTLKDIPVLLNRINSSINQVIEYRSTNTSNNQQTLNDGPMNLAVEQNRTIYDLDNDTNTESDLILNTNVSLNVDNEK